MAKKYTNEELGEMVGEMQTDIGNLHDQLERMGKNSKNTTDIFGRRFPVPVDAEHKATQDPLGTTLCVIANPHMRAFHMSWFGFFTSFYSTFAAAPLYAYIADDLNLTDMEWGLSGTFAIFGTIFCTRRTHTRLANPPLRALAVRSRRQLSPPRLAPDRTPPLPARNTIQSASRWA